MQVKRKEVADTINTLVVIVKFILKYININTIGCCCVKVMRSFVFGLLRHLPSDEMVQDISFFVVLPTRGIMHSGSAAEGWRSKILLSVRGAFQ